MVSFKILVWTASSNNHEKLELFELRIMFRSMDVWLFWSVDEKQLFKGLWKFR